MGVDKLKDQGPPHPPAGASPPQRRAAPSAHSRETSAKTRRPDREVYVPRARRSASSATSSASAPQALPEAAPFSSDPVAACESSTVLVSSARTDKSSVKKPTDKSFCNVYTPPHLRALQIGTPSGQPSVNCSTPPNSVGDERQALRDSARSDLKPSAARKRQLPQDDPHSSPPSAAAPLHPHHAPCITQEHLIPPPLSPDSSFTQNDHVNFTSEPLEDRSELIENNSMWKSDKDEDKEQNELERATQEINRSNRRLIKQSFVSDVLIISEPSKGSPPRELDSSRESRESAEPVKLQWDSVTADGANEKKNCKKDKEFNPLEEDWEAMLDENGECLEPALLAELTEAVGRVTVQQPRTAPFRSAPTPTIESGPFAHVLEVYNFPSEFSTMDLLSVFSDFKDTGFEIKWVDDNHALAVFSSAKIAEEVLAYSHPLVRTRPLQEATQESRQKARKCASFLQPYRVRPETCAALARRLVTGALGVRLPTASQERLEERRLLSQAREKKRLAAQQREAVWEGSLEGPPPPS